MKRFAQTIRLRPEGAEEYVRQHSAVWPSVTHMIRQCNIQNYSIFIKDLTLFAYFEYVGNDFKSDMDRMAADADTQRWWNVVKPLMLPCENCLQGEFWSDMEEIFHLD